MLTKPKTIATLVFIILTFLFFLFYIDPRLLYHAQEPPFLLDAHFFSNFAAYPGGMIWYFSAFLTQFYMFPWAGAFIITTIIFINYWQTTLFLQHIGADYQFMSNGHAVRDDTGKLLNNKRWVAAGTIPALLLFAACCNYLLPISYAVGMLAALLSANLYLSCLSGKTPLRLVLFIIILAGLYYFSATGALLFAVLCALHEFLSRKNYFTGAVIVVITSVLPFLAANFVFVISVPSAYYDFIGLKTSLLEAATCPRTPLLVYGAYLSFPVLFVAAYLVSLFGRTRHSTAPARQSHAVMAGFPLQTVLVAVMGLGIVFFFFDKKAKANYQIDYYARHGLWGRITQTIKPSNLNDFSILSQMHLFRALYYDNRLLADLFTYPQALPGQAFQMITGKMAKCYPVQMSDCYFEAGALNQAEFWANEALALAGKKPHVLQRLALINALKGRKPSALKFIALLDKTLFSKEEGRECRRFIENDPLADIDGRLRNIRSYSPRKEYLCRDLYAELVNLFVGNSENRTAFEYIVALNLLNNSISPLMDNTGYFAKFGYRSLPRHVQEAVVLQMVMSQQSAATVSGYHLDEIYFKRFTDFNAVLYEHRTDRATALKILAPAYGTTYWYYLASTNRPVLLKQND
jgi:hypothetical protein